MYSGDKFLKLLVATAYNSWYIIGVERIRGGQLATLDLVDTMFQFRRTDFRFDVSLV